MVAVSCLLPGRAKDLPAHHRIVCTVRVPNCVIYCVLHLGRVVSYTMYCTCAKMVLYTVHCTWSELYTVRCTYSELWNTVYCTCAELCYIMCNVRVPNCVTHCVLHVCQITSYVFACKIFLSESTFSFAFLPISRKNVAFLEGSLASPICRGKSNMKISVDRMILGG